ncbi:YxiJ family protein [Paenibacillus sp. PL2-23]|uniref:YxiJ family protein n=1 Tax=Paenibacillus sp. PL2-23 TaxID=2100729 RepID=UPI0030F9CC2B
MNSLVEKLGSIELDHPFPYGDIHQLLEDFQTNFQNLQEDESSLIADFNTYCMNIAGSRSYVLTGSLFKIPRSQQNMLKYSFFEMFPQYQFLEGRITTYQQFYREYRSFEEARSLLLRFLAGAK